MDNNTIKIPADAQIVRVYDEGGEFVSYHTSEIDDDFENEALKCINPRWTLKKKCADHPEVHANSITDQTMYSQ